MRRKDREITDPHALKAIIEGCDVCRICMNDSPVPYVVPVNFGYAWDGALPVFYIHSAKEGRKLDLLRRDPHVAFEMDCRHRLVPSEDGAECTMAYESVMGTGTVRFLDGQEKYDALVQILRRYGNKASLPEDHPVIRHTEVFALTAETITGKALKK